MFGVEIEVRFVILEKIRLVAILDQISDIGRIVFYFSTHIVHFIIHSSHYPTQNPIF
jgi:hypothetical protein